jgi:hypothetical protein
VKTLLEFLCAGKVTPAVDETFPLSAVPEAAHRQGRHHRVRPTEAGRLAERAGDVRDPPNRECALFHGDSVATMATLGVRSRSLKRSVASEFPLNHAV